MHPVPSKSRIGGQPVFKADSGRKERRGDDAYEYEEVQPNASSVEPPPAHITLHILSHCPRILPLTLSQYQMDTLLIFFSAIILERGREGDNKIDEHPQEEQTQRHNAETRGTRSKQTQESSSSPYLINLALALLISYLEQSESLRKRFHKWRKSEIPWYRFAINERLREAAKDGGRAAEMWARQLVRLREMMGLHWDVLQEERELVDLMRGMKMVKKETGKNMESPPTPTNAAEHPEAPSVFSPADEQEDTSAIKKQHHSSFLSPLQQQHKPPSLDWAYMTEAISEWFEGETRQGRDADLRLDHHLYIRALKDVHGEKAVEQQMEQQIANIDQKSHSPVSPVDPRDSSYMDRYLTPSATHPYDDDRSSNADYSDVESGDETFLRRDSSSLDQPPTLKTHKRKTKSVKKKRKSQKTGASNAHKSTPSIYVSQYGNIVLDSLAVWIEDDPKQAEPQTLERRLMSIKAASFAKPLASQTNHRQRGSRRLKNRANDPVIFDFTVFSTQPPNQLMQSKLNEHPVVYELIVQLRCTELPSACELMLTPVPSLPHYKPQITHHVHVPPELHFEVHRQTNQMADMLREGASTQLRAKFCDTLWDAMQFEEVIQMPFQMQERGVRIQVRAADHDGLARACAIRDVWIVEKKSGHSGRRTAR